MIRSPSRAPRGPGAPRRRVRRPAKVTNITTELLNPRDLKTYSVRPRSPRPKYIIGYTPEKYVIGYMTGNCIKEMLVCFSCLCCVCLMLYYCDGMLLCLWLCDMGVLLCV